MSVCTNQGCKAIEIDTKKVNVNYLYYYLLSSVNELNNLGTGTTFMEISSDSLKNFPVPLPGLKHQKILAGFLDEKTAIIDKMITSKINMRRHLTEFRQATIAQELFLSHRDDNIHLQLRHVALLQSTKQKAVPDMPIIMLENIESWTGRLLGSVNPDSVIGELLVYKKGDVLFNKLRPYLAKVYVGESDGLCTSEMLVLRPNQEKIDSRYLFYYLASKKIIDEINITTYGVKMPRANWSFIGSLAIDLPPLSQQHHIVSQLDRTLAKIDKMDSKLKNSIEQLEEYRTSLISNVISGKVDV
jgi:type I restriction enzyme S subunit